jgi:DNA (cytosine-5)-methyltransferase 1
VNATALRPRDILSRIDELLEANYRLGDVASLQDPLAEAVFILIGQHGCGLGHRRAFHDLREALPAWQDVMKDPYTQVEGLLSDAGIGSSHVIDLKALLTKVDDANAERGVGPYAQPPSDLTLNFLHEMDDIEAERFLRNLPGLGPKGARYVMAGSLGRAAFAADTHVDRILDRLGVVTSTGSNADAHPLQDAVPAEARARLHMNLAQHARAVCRSQSEKCGDCILVSFCRRGRAAVADADDRPIAVDLFAGAGGMGAGFEKAGFHVGLAVERDRHAAQTYRLNHPGVPVLEAEIGPDMRGKDLRKFAPALREVAAVVGGPPCQGYSVAATRNRSPDDPRNHLYRHAARLASELRARTIAIENVPGIRSVSGHGFVDSIKQEFRAAGYAVEAHLVRASEFGVPQRRMRFFFLGVRDRRRAPPPAPKPSHRPLVNARLETEALPLTPSVTDTLAPLPKIEAGYREPWARLEDGTEIPNVMTMRHSEAVIKKIVAIPAGGGPISYRRLESDEARTIVAGHRALPVHPKRDRTLSVREAAAIQGFDLTYHFCGPPAAQPLQVANAVPPPVAEAAASVLKRYCN